MKKKTEKILACALALCLLLAAVAVPTSCGSPAGNDSQTGNGSPSDSNSPTDSSSLTGNGKEAPPSANWWKDYIDLETAAETYTLKDAKAAGYVVIDKLKVTAGQNAWEDFVRCTEQGKPAKIRVACVGERAKDDSGYVSSLTEVEFDSEKYIKRNWNDDDDKIQEQVYKYMLRFEEDPPRPMPSYVSVIYWVLTDDDALTWDHICSHFTGDAVTEPIAACDIVYAHYTH